MKKPEKDPKKTLLDNNQFLMLVSLALAVIAWMLVTMVISRDTNTTLTNIPVDFTYNTSGYISQGLDIVNEPEATVSVRFDGNGTTIGSIRPDDIVVYPDYSGVRGAGSQELNLLVRITNTLYTNGVTATIDSSNRTVTVVFDRVVTRTIPVTVQAEDLRLAENYVLNRTVSSPVEVTVSGPESEVNSIDRAVAQVTVEDQLSDSVTVPARVELQDDQGSALSLLYTTLDPEYVDVTISVYLQKELPLSVNFINVSPNFDVNTLSYTLSHETLTVAGSAQQVEAMSEIGVASFDLSTYQPNQTYQLAVNLPNGLVSQEGVSNVTLTIDGANLSTKTMNVTNIRQINLPSGVEVEVQAGRISNVTLVGPQEALDELVPANLEALLDGSDIMVSDGMQDVPVTINIPSRSDVFVTGTYTVQCSVSAEE